MCFNNSFCLHAAGHARKLGVILEWERCVTTSGQEGVGWGSALPAMPPRVSPHM